MGEVTPSIKDVIKQEYLKSAQDPVHFMKKYTMIQHPMRGRIPFHLYPFQEKVLNLFQHHNDSIILKSRQLGISTLVAGYSLWLMLFNQDKNILCIATKQETAKNMVTKVKFMYDNLPSWLKGNKKPLEDNKLSLKLANGSQIKAVSAASDAGRSEAVSLLILDEAAFIEDIEKIYTSAQQTLSTGGSCIALSTPNGVGNWFHNTWVKAELGEKNMIPIRLPWKIHPERDQKWRDKQDIELGPRFAAQECFSEDVIIYTLNGPKYIKDIEIGDQVLSHDGSYNNVLRKFNSESDNIYSIKSGLNNKKKYVTGNHPFLNINEEWKTIKDLIDNNEYIQSFPTNVKINQYSNKIDLSSLIFAENPKYFPLKIEEDKIWITKKHICPRYLDFDYDLGFIVGCYLSEGSTWNNVVSFSYNYETERNSWIIDLENRLNKKFNIKIFSHYKDRKFKSSNLYIKSQLFKKFIELCIEGGKYCNEKHISKFVYENSNIETLKGILDGIMIGDGMLKKEYNCSIGLTSEKLIYDVKYISNVLGINNISIKSGKNDHNNVINTLTFLNSKNNISTKYVSEKLEDINKNNRFINKFVYDNKPLTKLKLKKESLNKIVYNIEVENTHTYVTEYGIAHNCDCDFLTSGNTIIEPDILNFYEKTWITEPLEKRGIGGNYWIWQYPDYSRQYIITADVARGDGTDFSAFHVIDVESCEQIAEFKAQLGTREFGHTLITAGVEYNNALIAVENNSVGWDVVQTLLESNYPNMYYSPRGQSDSIDTYISKMETDQVVPGFTNSMRTRPLLIPKLESYLRDKTFVIRSRRFLEELRVLIWDNGKCKAANGYNDDLVLSGAIAMYIRDTALKYQQYGTSLTKATLNNIQKTQGNIIYNQGNYSQNPYHIPLGNGQIEDVSWILKD